MKRRVLVLDFDGVVRIWPGGDFATELERHYLLPVGSVASLYETPVFGDVIVGRASAREWRGFVFEALGAEAGRTWLTRPVQLNHNVLSSVRRRQRRGSRTVLFSNGTDELRLDLASLGLEDFFDAVYNSAEMGVAKPDLAAYAFVQVEEEVEPRQISFLDDNVKNVDAARRAGWLARAFTSNS